MLYLIRLTARAGSSEDGRIADIGATRTTALQLLAEYRPEVLVMPGGWDVSLSVDAARGQAAVWRTALALDRIERAGLPIWSDITMHVLRIK